MSRAAQRLSTRLRALDRAAFLGARDREAVRAGDMGKGLGKLAPSRTTPAQPILQEYDRKRRPNSRSPGPPTGDRRAALLVKTVDLYLIPHAVYARIGTGKGVHGGAVLGVNHEYAAHGSLAVISNECARSHNVDIVVGGVIEMNAVGANRIWLRWELRDL